MIVIRVNTSIELKNAVDKIELLFPKKNGSSSHQEKAVQVQSDNCPKHPKSKLFTNQDGTRSHTWKYQDKTFKCDGVKVGVI